MAKNHGRRRRRFTLRRVRVANGVATGALAALDVTAGPITDVATDPYRLITADLSFKLVDLGAAIDDGQEFGLAHSDYTSAEVEECLEAQASIDLGNKVAQEQANRLVRSIGTLTGDAVASGGKYFNDGQPVKVKLNWRMSTGDQLNIWIRNASSVVWSSGAAMTASGNLWIKDV